MLTLDVLPCECQHCRRNALTFRCPSDDFRIGFRSGCKSLGEGKLVRDYISPYCLCLFFCSCARLAFISPLGPRITVLKIRRDWSQRENELRAICAAEVIGRVS